eukprot:Nk52_evm1s1603 gene=Nk52_evmTU1s1603
MVELTHKTTPVLLTLGKGLNAISCYISPLIGHVGGCGLLVGTETMKKLGVVMLMHEELILWNTFSKQEVIRALEQLVQSEKGKPVQEKNFNIKKAKSKELDVAIAKDVFKFERGARDQKPAIIIVDQPY